MSNLKKAICFSATLAMTSFDTFAVDSADLRLSGQYQPGSCTPTFSDGGVIDYGTIKASSLKATEYTLLDVKDLTFSINCSGAAKTVAFMPLAGRLGTEITNSGSTGRYGYSGLPDGVRLFGLSNSMRATGLGLDRQGNKIGGMAMMIKSGVSELDGNRANYVVNKGTSIASWGRAAPSSGIGQWSSFVEMYSWGHQQTHVPKPFITMTTTVNVQAFLNKAEELDLSQEVHLDGLVTFELVYL